MKPRRLLFWLHLSAGVSAGIVILIMSVTGLLLAYQRQITAWVDHRHLGVVIPQEKHLPVEALVASAQQSAGGRAAGITLRADRAMPAEVTFGRERVVFVNPYTGETLGEGSQSIRAFFSKVEDWHRTLAFSDEHRDAGRVITGLCSLAFLILVSTGFIIWWPSNLSWQRFRSASSYRRQATSRARDRNWHTVTGFWLAVPVMVLAFSATIMGNPWASNLLYVALGSANAPRGGPQGAAQAGAGAEPREGRGGRGGARARGGADSDPAVLARLDELWTRAEQQVPGWQTISLRLPVQASGLEFSIDSGSGGRPDKRSTLTLNGSTGEIVDWRQFSNDTLGQRARQWIRWTHTGEAGGLLGQTIAALGCAAGILLVCTGLLLAWRRLFGWSSARLRGAYALGSPPPRVNEERVSSD